MLIINKKFSEYSEQVNMYMCATLIKETSFLDRLDAFSINNKQHKSMIIKSQSTKQKFD